MFFDKIRGAIPVLLTPLNHFSRPDATEQQVRFLCVVQLAAIYPAPAIFS